MFDVFYLGRKPALFPHEVEVESIQQAQCKSRTRYCWIITYLADYTGFDFLWEPAPWQADFVHVWPSQWHDFSGTYLVPKHVTELSYHFHDHKIPNRSRPEEFQILIPDAEFDFTWSPHPLDPPYNYVFGNQWWPATKWPTVRYPVPGAVDEKFDSGIHARLPEIKDANWITLHDCEFDYSWRPDPGDPPFIYVFGNQWWPAEKMATVEYRVPGAEDRKFLSYPKARLLSNAAPWTVPEGLDTKDLDLSWVPDPGSPPYIYQFGTQWQKTGGPRYLMPGATEVKYVDKPRFRRVARDPHWCIPDNMNLDSFDWTWHPDDTEPPWRYQFPTQWNRAGGPEYIVPGATEIKFVDAQTACMLPTDRNWHIPDGIDLSSFDFSWTPDPTEKPFVYQFGTQWQKTGGPSYAVPGAAEIKFVLEPRARKTVKDINWGIPANAVYDDDFDWTWHPDATEQPFVYQFGTQHQKTGGPIYRQAGATEIKYVDQVRITVKAAAASVCVIDHIDGHAESLRLAIADRVTVIKTVRYVDNYLDTLRRISAGMPDDIEYLWIVSSVCDYTDFDFTWYPEQWQATMLHVFASGDQKFGDTFFMHVPTFRLRSQTCQLLDWYDVNYVPDLSVPRRPMPVIRHDQDSHVDLVKSQSWTGPLVLLTNLDHVARDLVTVPLWREQTKTIVPLSEGATSVVIPKTAVPYIKSQLYDYPYIDRSQKILNDTPLDVVFISNGEHGAEHHWSVLQGALKKQHASNRLHRVDGVNGRVAAYQTAARQSQTPWFFAVFAKLQVNEDFDWRWQPDRMQQAKHYIFHAYNPVNHLIYGHQAMIAYNVSMTLTNAGEGLDFTLDQLHEVVPVLSGTAYYDNDPWTCWRTAFRECIKLRHGLPDVENDYRLQQWLSVGEGTNGHWSTTGANDAVKYYESVGGDFDKLKKSYEWSWLASFALMLHPELVTQSRT